jgi:hypothetical protein
MVTVRKFFICRFRSPLNRRVISRAFNARVPASVIVGAVTVALSVIFIMFIVVGHKIVEREAIVARHEVDTLLCLALLVSINLRAANDPVSHAAHRTGFTAKEAPHVIAELSIPLPPTVAYGAAYLVEPSRIPRFGHQLGSGERRL